MGPRGYHLPGRLRRFYIQSKALVCLAFLISFWWGKGGGGLCWGSGCGKWGKMEV